MAEKMIPKIEFQPLKPETISPDTPFADSTARPVRPEVEDLVAAVFANYFRRTADRAEQVRLVEGYRVMAEEDQSLAESDMAAGFETLPDE